MSVSRDLDRVVAEAFKEVQQAFVLLGEQVKAAMADLQCLFHHMEGVTLAHRRATLGGMRTDAYHHPQQWQSLQCAGLICSIAPCPSDKYHLRCTHSCHAE